MNVIVIFQNMILFIKYLLKNYKKKRKAGKKEKGMLQFHDLQSVQSHNKEEGWRKRRKIVQSQ